MPSLPDDLKAYKRTATFTAVTVPQGLLKDHNTKTGTWGLLHVTAGAVRYIVPSQQLDVRLEAGDKGVIEPQMPHRVAPEAGAEFFVEFWR